MNLYKHIEQIVKNELNAIPEIAEFLQDHGKDIVVEVPKNRDFGDFATNAAMVLSRPMKSNPRAIAEIIVKKLSEVPEIKKCEIAGPGFINITIAPSLWDKLLGYVVAEKDNYGSSDFGKNQKINVEFLSANPTGPIHVGHTRGAIFGDVLSRLLAKIGYNVTKEYYINDFGQQVGVLARSVMWRYEELFDRHKEDTFPEGAYPGEYVIPVAQKIKSKDGDKWLDKPESDWLDYFKQIAVNDMMDIIRANLADLGIYFDVFTSEKSLVDSKQVDKVLKVMKSKGLVYEGTLPKPLGEDIKDWTPEVQLLFKATEFGDDVDRVVARSNGVTTYFTSDIAYHLDKYQRGFKEQIDIWGADHGGYIKRIKSALSSVTDGKASLEVKLYQIVNLEKDGKPFRMSKRAGNFVLVGDILDEIESDAFRLFMITKSADSQMTFDLAKAKEQSKDNPVFYIQYAHARANSVLKKFAETFGSEADTSSSEDFYASSSEIEQNLIKSIADYPSIIEASAKSRSPQVLSSYLEELSRQFHSLWTVGAKEGIRFIDADNKALSQKRMLLVTALKNTIANGLKTIGVVPKEVMENLNTPPEE